MKSPILRNGQRQNLESVSQVIQFFFQAEIYIIDVPANDKPPSVQVPGHQDIGDKDFSLLANQINDWERNHL